MHQPTQLASDKECRRETVLSFQVMVANPTAIPGVETYVVMITTGRNKRRLITQPLHQLETEHVAVEPERAFKISDLQVHMTYSNAGIDRIEWHVSQLTTSGMSWQRLGETGVASKRLRYRARDRESFCLRRGARGQVKRTSLKS
jgi:hypothetical protein